MFIISEFMLSVLTALERPKNKKTGQMSHGVGDHAHLEA